MDFMRGSSRERQAEGSTSELSRETLRPSSSLSISDEATVESEAHSSDIFVDTYMDFMRGSSRARQEEDSRNISDSD